MGQVSNNLAKVRSILPEGVGLTAVSKFQSLASLQEAYAAGQRRFGESRADELEAKAAAMPDDVEWHFIGHLQSNKVRRVVKFASVIESIDSERLLRLVSAEAERISKVVDVYLQVHVAAEETKSGFLPDELIECARRCVGLNGVRVRGVMGMASNTDDERRVDADFAAIADVGRRLREVIGDADVLSMGMSGDWPVAVRHGATLVRIGSAIFGDRC